jgi:outer membrane protein insertion porin family
VVEGFRIPLNLLQPIWDANVFEEWGLAEGEAKILAYMRQKGYLFAQVQSSFAREDNILRVLHRVIPGDRYRVGNPEFKGLTHLTVDRIKDELGLSENFLFLNRTDKARLFNLPAEIESLYKTLGFANARVDLTFERQGSKVKPIVHVEEGFQNTIARIDFEGNSHFTREDLLHQIHSRSGGPFYRPNIQKDRGALETFYLDKGIRGTEIVSESELVEERSFALHFHVQEGNVATIDKIIVTGNDVTRKATILREITIKAGDLASNGSILETKRKLEGLGIFSEVTIEEIPVSEGKINLLINVHEGQRNYASLGLGVETEEEAQSLDIWNNAIRLRGTGELIRSNIFGSAHQLSLVGQLSLREKRAVLSWEQPYFFGLPLETYVNAWLESEERKSYGFTRRGFSLTTITPISGNSDMIFLITMRYARTRLFRLSIPESSVDRQHFPYSTTSISGSLIWDQRDDPFNPRKGHFLSSVIEWAYPLFNSESDFQKIFSKYQQYVPLIPNVTLNYTTRLGLGRGVIPIHERFFAGGSNSFRGEEFDELGPNDPDSLQPIGGKALILFNLELSFPLIGGLKDLNGVVFFDKGNVFAKRSLVRWEELNDAVGFGLRYKTPFGPLRVELGWNLDAPQGEKKPIAFITIGNVF